MPAELPPLELSDAACAQMLPQRERRSHKGTHGTLLCLCGSLDYAGAALLVASAAMRAGTGLVALAVPASLQPVFAGRVLEAVTLGLPDERGDIDADAAAAIVKDRDPDAIACGSGWQEADGNARLLMALLGDPGADGSPPPPMVVDGSALNMLARAGEWWPDVARRCVLTPHPREFGRLTGEPVADDDAERQGRAAAAAARFGQVVVLKGARTVVAAPDGRVASATFENPALATAGTGDVLAGVIGGLLAQGLAPFEAACLGVYMHGAAAARISDRIGDAGMLASDLLREIPLVRHALARLRSRPSARVGFASRTATGAAG